MKPFKFLRDNTSNRTLIANLPYAPAMPSDRLRWIDVNVNNLNFRVYTHHSLDEIQHIVGNVIEPFIFEHNNQNNRNIILRMLQARFHRAIIENRYERV